MKPTSETVMLPVGGGWDLNWIGPRIRIQMAIENNCHIYSERPFLWFWETPKAKPGSAHRHHHYQTKPMAMAFPLFFPICYKWPIISSETLQSISLRKIKSLLLLSWLPLFFWCLNFFISNITTLILSKQFSISFRAQRILLAETSRKWRLTATFKRLWWTRKRKNW